MINIALRRTVRPTARPSANARPPASPSDRLSAGSSAHQPPDRPLVRPTFRPTRPPVHLTDRSTARPSARPRVRPSERRTDRPSASPPVPLADHSAARPSAPIPPGPCCCACPQMCTRHANHTVHTAQSFLSFSRTDSVPTDSDVRESKLWPESALLSELSPSRLPLRRLQRNPRCPASILLATQRPRLPSRRARGASSQISIIARTRRLLSGSRLFDRLGILPHPMEPGAPIVLALRAVVPLPAG